MRLIRLIIWMVFLTALTASAQTTVYFNFTDPAYGLSQTTNRTVVLQAESGTSVNGGNVLLPFQLRTTTDVNGYCAFTNLNGSPISGYYHVTLPAPPSRADFDIWVSSTNLGYVNGNTLLGVFGSSTYPAAVFAWGAQVSDARYGVSTNSYTNFVLIGQLNTASNVLAASILANGVASTNFTLSASNSLASQIVASTNGGGLVNITNIANYLIGQSNQTVLTWIASTNFNNLATTTNMVNLASNNVQYGLYTVINTASNVTAAIAQFNLTATNTALTASIGASNGLVASALILTNFQILQVATNLVASSSNNALPFAVGVSNNVISEHAFAVGISNTVATASNTVSATALANLNSTNAALTSQINATNTSIIAYVNTSIASATNFGPVYSTIFNASNAVAANAQSSLVSSNAAQGAALVATNGQIISYVGTYTASAIAISTNGIGATITLTSNALQTQAFSISNSVLASANAGSNANAAYTLSISNNDVSTLNFSKGVSNSLVVGTNTVLTTAIAATTSGTNAAMVALANGTNAAYQGAAILLAQQTVFTYQAITAGSNAVLAAMASTNFQNLQVTTNLASAVSNNLTSALTLSINTASNTVATNLANLIIQTNTLNLTFATNALVGTSNSLVNLTSNNFVLSTNFTATSGTNFVTPTTNILGIAYGGSLAMNQTYLNPNSGMGWTNVGNPNIWVNLAGGVWTAQSNAVTMYTWTTIPGTVTTVQGILPAPNVFYGRYRNYAGEIATNSPTGSLTRTNSTWGTNSTFTLAAQPFQEYLQVSNGVALPYMIINLTTNHQ